VGIAGFDRVFSTIKSTSGKLMAEACRALMVDVGVSIGAAWQD
jgi:hypothetical protein